MSLPFGQDATASPPLPRRVRGDHGGENLLADFPLLLRLNPPRIAELGESQVPFDPTPRQRGAVRDVAMSTTSTIMAVPPILFALHLNRDAEQDPEPDASSPGYLTSYHDRAWLTACACCIGASCCLSIPRERQTENKQIALELEINHKGMSSCCDQYSRNDIIESSLWVFLSA